MLIIGYRHTQAAPPAGLGVVRMTAFSDGANDASASLQIPAGVAAGNTLIAVLKSGSFALRTIKAVPPGWTLVGSDNSDHGMHVYRKTADGTEGGTTATWMTDSGCNSAFVLAEVPGDRTVEVTFVAGSIDPPSHVPAGGSAETVWLAITGARRGDNDVTGAPAGYSGLATAVSHAHSHASNVRLAGAHKTGTAASEDPGAFTWTGSRTGLQACTISVR